MAARALSQAARRRITLVFRPEVQEAAAAALESTDFGMTTWEDYYLDRIRFATLKLSEGDLAKLRHWIAEAERGDEVDWRAVIGAAEFGSRVEAHTEWLADGTNEWPEFKRDSGT
jgi:hypothetical protein